MNDPGAALTAIREEIQLLTVSKKKLPRWARAFQALDEHMSCTSRHLPNDWREFKAQVACGHGDCRRNWVVTGDQGCLHKRQ